jgi:hypothetical protein
MALLHVAVRVVFVGTNVAADAGTVETTVGGVVFALIPVVKFHRWLPAIKLPLELCTVAAIAAVNCILGTRLTVGVNNAALPRPRR